jgi:hypothetical protein
MTTDIGKIGWSNRETENSGFLPNGVMEKVTTLWEVH